MIKKPSKRVVIDLDICLDTNEDCEKRKRNKRR
jgi:hypothetical protein